MSTKLLSTSQTMPVKMKPSIYNTRLTLNEKIDVIFNSLTQRFLLMKSDVTLDSITEEHKLYDQLVESGILIDNAVDEIDVVNNIDRRVIQQTDFFRLTVNPTLDCNLHCWYCYEAKQKGSVMSEKVIASTLKLVDHICDNQQVINLSFFGGEPFKVFDEVVVKILAPARKIIEDKGKKYTIGFTTNGTLVDKEKIQFLKDFNPASFQITLDGSREFHDTVRISKELKQTYDLIMENVNALLENGFFVTLRVNYTDKNIASLSTISEDIITKIESIHFPKLFVNFHQVWQNSFIDLHKEIDEVLDTFANLGINASRPIFNNLHRPCYADYLNSAVINFNGDVYKCTAIDFLNTPRDGYLNENGNIIWESECQALRGGDYKIKSEKCSACRIRPICNGACSQKVIQHSRKDYCIFNDNETEKDRVVLDIFSDRINHKQLLKEKL